MRYIHYVKNWCGPHGLVFLEHQDLCWASPRFDEGGESKSCWKPHSSESLKVRSFISWRNVVVCPHLRDRNVTVWESDGGSTLENIPFKRIFHSREHTIQSIQRNSQFWAQEQWFLRSVETSIHFSSGPSHSMMYFPSIPLMHRQQPLHRISHWPSSHLGVGGLKVFMAS